MVVTKFSSCQQCLPFTWQNQTFHLENFRKRGFGRGEAMFVLFSVCFPFMGVACEQALRGRAGREKEGELANTSLEFEFHLQFPCGSPSTELSHFHQSRRSRNECKINVNEHWKTHAKGNDVVTVISTNQHFALTFLIQVFRFQRHSCKLSFRFLPRPREFAHRLLWRTILPPRLVWWYV